MLDIAKPYLLFLGDVQDPLDAKTAMGLKEWRPEWCAGQFRLPGCVVDLDLPNMIPAAAAAAGVRTLVVGIAPDGGQLPPAWRPHLLDAIDAGLDIAAGLHSRLNGDEELAARAALRGRRLIDVRNPPRAFATGTGERRTGKRVITVGTDCAVGKKYTALAIEREMRSRGIAADYRATGQTGILIAERGVAIDAVVADFVSGAAEWLSPGNDADHWDVIEGQGSLFHPSYAAVTLGLIHGSQPDAIVLCHELGRTHISNMPKFPLPSFDECAAAYLAAAHLTNPSARVMGVALNTSAHDEVTATLAIQAMEAETDLPCTDPLRFGCAALVDALVEM